MKSRPRIRIEAKVCTKCGGDPQPRSAFTANPHKVDGLQSWCRKCAGEAIKAYRNREPDKRRNAQVIKSRNLKTKVLLKFGCRCAECGYSDRRALQIDHVHNDGNAPEERTPNGRRISSDKLRQKALADTEGRYQLLCANCNAIKAYENNLCRLAAEKRLKSLNGEKL